MPDFAEAVRIVKDYITTTRLNVSPEDEAPFIIDYKETEKDTKHLIFVHTFLTVNLLKKSVVNQENYPDIVCKAKVVLLKCFDCNEFSPSLKKVENVLNQYQKALENATEWKYIELDSVFIDYKHQFSYESYPINDTTDWYYDGILTVNINGVEEYVGILEVIGNSIVENNIKMIGDRNKLLKAMQLALF
ncbi:unnamed protein product [Rhizophagus irregularis]|nr:unnamed protein product [Rhizophagus irregularis]CAB4423129.1 unnamed protein product [Rhizophagus irregularis]